jgi:hypothetical protein
MADPQPAVSGGPGSAALLRELMERLALVEPQAASLSTKLLELAAGKIDPGTEIVLISTRAVDLGRLRSEAQLGDSRYAAMMRHVRVVDASNDGITKYFQPD